MLGLTFYSFAAYGFGAFVPRIQVPGMNDFGIGLVFGYSVLTALLFLLISVAGLEIQSSIYVLLLLALAGIAIRIRRRAAAPLLRDMLTHPGLVLTLVGAVSIVANGGIDYLPTSSDDFSNWIGVSRQIHAAGEFDVIRGSLNHPGYTPGWRFLLLAPWQMGGEALPGLSAAAPFVFHVAVTAMVFDLIVYAFREHLEISAKRAQLYSWAVILLYLAAEAMGRLWTLYLLIEPPQIYSYVAVFLFLYLSEKHQSQRVP